MEEAASQPEPSQPEDYSLAAFEWVESHLEELNTLCNECIAQKQDFLLLTGGGLAGFVPRTIAKRSFLPHGGRRRSHTDRAGEPQKGMM